MRREPWSSAERCARRAGALSVLCAVATCVQGGTLRIVSPTVGAIVHSGGTFVVEVEAPPASFKSVAVSANDPIETPDPLHTPPFRFALRIPATAASGVYRLRAVGTTAADEWVKSPQITVDVERPDRPVRLENDLRTLVFTRLGHTIRVDVDGIYADGARVDLKYSSLSEYSSDNTAVVAIDQGGMATAVGPGSATITVTNNGASLALPAKVEIHRSQ